MKSLIAWFDELVDDMRFFADKARNFRRNFRHNIGKTKTVMPKSTGAQIPEPLQSNIGSHEPVPLINPIDNDDFTNVISPFKGYNKPYL
ncbi:hypothetical protein D6V26_07160 [Vibrio cholerae]|nr:hypothetical protein [Vibrio cholerae]